VAILLIDHCKATRVIPHGPADAVLSSAVRMSLIKERDPLAAQSCDGSLWRGPLRCRPASTGNLDGRRLGRKVSGSSYLNESGPIATLRRQRIALFGLGHAHGAGKYGIGWTMWDYAGGFAVVNKQNGHAAPDVEIVRALGLAVKTVAGFSRP